MRRHLGFLLLALTLVGISGSVPGGHTPISSRWNYNEHLFPIFRDRCGACHIEGGIAPMSLLEYQSAYPWTQSIREEILGLRMPPWQAEDGFGDFKNGHALAAHEMDMILEWSSGGYPQGPRNLTPAPPLVVDTWALGEPTLTLQLAEPFALGPSANDVVRYFVVPSGTSEDHILTGVDFRPGAQAVVRGALVFVDATGTAQALDADDDGPGFAPADGQPFPTSPPVGVFTPGQEAVLNIDVGYPLPAGADIVVRIHYKKTWITEGMDFAESESDRAAFLQRRRTQDRVSARDVPVGARDSGGDVHPHRDPRVDDPVPVPRDRHPIDRAPRRGDPAGRIARADALAPRARHRLADAVLVRVAPGTTSWEPTRGDGAARAIRSAGAANLASRRGQLTDSHVRRLPGRRRRCQRLEARARPIGRALAQKAVDLHELGVQDRRSRRAADRVVTECDELVVEHRTIA